MAKKGRSKRKSPVQQPAVPDFGGLCAGSGMIRTNNPTQVVLNNQASSSEIPEFDPKSELSPHEGKTHDSENVLGSPEAANFCDKAKQIWEGFREKKTNLQGD